MENKIDNETPLDGFGVALFALVHLLRLPLLLLFEECV
jgi:hypothetical protein